MDVGKTFEQYTREEMGNVMWTFSTEWAAQKVA